MNNLINSLSIINSLRVEMWRSCQAGSYDQALDDGAVRTIESCNIQEVGAMLKSAVMVANMIESQSPVDSIKVKFSVNGLPIKEEYFLVDWQQFFIDFEAGEAKYF